MSTTNEVQSLGSVIKKGFKESVKDLHTCIPGQIVEFYPANQTASVQVTIKRGFLINGEVKYENLPKLINAPVIFPRGGGFALTFPVKTGDECLIMFSERSIDNWFRTGKIEKPSARRFHDLSDAMVLLGLSSSPNAIEDINGTDVELKKEDGSVSIKLTESGDIEMIATNIKITGDLDISGSVTNNSKNIGSTHTHTGSATAPTGPVTPTGTPL